MVLRLGDVFVAGGLPTLTYIPRASYDLENSLKEHLDDGHHLICVTGPTKSGKTVLCRTVLEGQHPIWLDGGSIASEADFWDQLADALDAVEAQEEETSHATSKASGGGVEAGVGAGVASLKVGGSKTAVDSSEKKKTVRVARSKKAQALASLKNLQKCLVIDDFHYLDRDLQTVVVRSLKAPIFDGARVVFLAVPHRAYDVVRVEREMTGRVKQVEVPDWNDQELSEIASKGFSALNVNAPGTLISRLAREAWENPHLMQRFCNKLCRANQVVEKQSAPKALALPDYDFFFEDLAKETGKREFERLSRGPRQRSDRLIRKFVDGTEGDTYVVVLKALAETGPKAVVTYEELRGKIAGLLVDSTLQMHEVSRVLAKMSELQAAADGSAAPVDWDVEDRKVHVIDPFFAYYLKWGAFRPEK